MSPREANTWAAKLQCHSEYDGCHHFWIWWILIKYSKSKSLAHRTQIKLCLFQLNLKKIKINSLLIKKDICVNYRIYGLLINKGIHVLTEKQNKTKQKTRPRYELSHWDTSALLSFTCSIYLKREHRISSWDFVLMSSCCNKCCNK